MKNFIFKRYSLALTGMLLLLSPGVFAKTTLNEILQYAFVADPTLDEAKANISMAASQTKVSEAGHLPVVSLTGTSVLGQRHTYTSERRSGPGVAARVNLYAWGGVEAEIERDKQKETYYHYKLTETRELMGQDISQLYLSALRAKETLAVYKESLARHDKILRDLGVISTYDEGRFSEVNEAQSRKNQVETSILMQERILQSSLNRLSRYSGGKVLSVDDLIDPFSQVTDVNAFIKRYKNPEVTSNPSYLAQQAEFESSKAAVEAAKARRLPAINLEGTANRHEYEVYVNMSWDIYNPATKYAQEQSYYSQKAAEAKLREIELSVQEKSLTSEVDMVRNQRLATVAHKQIALQRKVVKDKEFQFEVAASSLMDLLDSYQELSRVQIDEVNARNDFRDAALLYLVSQSGITQWVGAENTTMKSKK
ncbi:TolC family protein [Rodentibacter myodis]|uniref:Transporter n=1 Tax=Rodentibacter myodis TaxID=1907939 RepID=A0A1V3JR25_9PAST|nr:TolC family protein [Rodentibacter myodis]OOF59261.1 transporter [Rodentibacter myodis]